MSIEFTTVYLHIEEICQASIRISPIEAAQEIVMASVVGINVFPKLDLVSGK